VCSCKFNRTGRVPASTNFIARNFTLHQKLDPCITVTKYYKKSWNVQPFNVKMTTFSCIQYYNKCSREALLLQRDHTTCLSVEILQLQSIPFEKDCNRQMSLKYIHPRSPSCCFQIGRIWLFISGLLLPWSLSSTIFKILPFLKWT